MDRYSNEHSRHIYLPTGVLGEMAGMAGPSSSVRLTEHLDDDGVLGRAVIVVYSIV